MKNKQSLVIVLVTLVILTLAGGLSLNLFNTSVAAAQTDEPTDTGLARTITVVGEGKVSVAPDLAQINIGVETIGPEVKQVSSEAGEVMEQLLTALETQGVASNDIQTSYYNIWLERPFSGPDAGPSGEVIYHVNNNVLVTVRDLNKITDILSATLDAGANSVNSITFNVADRSALTSEARQLAVDDALATAQELAALNGVEVGQVVSVSEVVTSGVFPVAEAYAAQGVGGGGVGPISPGEVEVSVQLQVSYAIQ